MATGDSVTFSITVGGAGSDQKLRTMNITASNIKPDADGDDDAGGITKSDRSGEDKRTPFQKRLHATGQDLCGWNEEAFAKLVNQHCDATWGQYASAKNKAKVIISALATVGSAALNVWFLTNNVMEIERDSTEHYNLTEWVLLMIEAIMVYFFVLATLLYICILPAGGPMGIHTPIVLLLSYIDMTGGFSMLLGIKVLTIDKLYAHFKRLLWLMKAMFCYTDGPMDKEKFPRSVLLCSGICCLPLWPLLFVFPFFAPAAFLLKVRQVAFVSTVYFRNWTRVQWFAFFGVINNVVGLTATENVSIESYQRALFGRPDDHEFKSHAMELRELISECIHKHTESVLDTFLIMNAWMKNPDVQYKMMKGFPPKDCRVTYY